MTQNASSAQSTKRGDVARALEQNTVIEEKVQTAAEDLEVVTQLLHEEVAGTARLPQELAERPANGADATGQHSSPAADHPAT